MSALVLTLQSSIRSLLTISTTVSIHMSFVASWQIVLIGITRGRLDDHQRGRLIICCFSSSGQPHCRSHRSIYCVIIYLFLVRYACPLHFSFLSSVFSISSVFSSFRGRFLRLSRSLWWRAHCLGPFSRNFLYMRVRRNKTCLEEKRSSTLWIQAAS